MMKTAKKTKNPQRRNWIVDAVLFVGLLVACLLDVTGLTVHEWLGVAVGLFALYHLVVHWTWVKAVTARFLTCTSNEARLYYVVDVGLLAGLLMIVGTGLVISTWLDLPLTNYTLWRDLHILASVATVALTVAKIGWHWKWVVQVARRSVFKSATPALAPVPVPAARPGAATSRRDFLRLMGGVSALAVLAVKPGLETWLASNSPTAAAAPLPVEGDSVALAADAAPTATLAAPTATAAATATQTAAAPTAGATVSATVGAPTAAATVTAPTATRAIPLATATPSAVAAAPSAGCTVRCNKRCSYPGQCRKYVDANRNGRCDLGECL